MNNIKNYLSELIFNAVKKIDVKESFSLQDIQIVFSPDQTHGDYTTNFVLANFSKIKKFVFAKNPYGVAEELVKEITFSNGNVFGQYIEKIEVVKPGFINFYLKDTYYIDLLETIICDESYGDSHKLENKKILLEFTDPNPFKEFHIGHLYSNIVGESISRLHESQSAVVRRANYQGDVGLHVAKTIWGILQRIKKEKVRLEDFNNKTLKEKVNFLGKAYAFGATAYEENDTAKNEIKEINYLVYVVVQKSLIEREHWEPLINYQKYLLTQTYNVDEIKKIYEIGKDWSLAYFEQVYKRLGTKFDFYFFESVLGEYGAKEVLDGVKKGIFEKSEGAIVFPGEKYGLHTRVFINSLGLPTYEAKEIGLFAEKHRKFLYDISVVITANEIDEYFKVILTAYRMIDSDLANKTIHLSHGVVRLPEGKMSSRTGKILTGEWLLNEAKSKAAVLLTQNNDIKEENREDLCEMIGEAAIKYALLSHSLGKDIEFSFDKSISLEGKSGPYLQYTFARTESLLRKFGNHLLDLKEKRIDSTNSKERELLKLLAIFPDIVTKATISYSPNIVANYLFDLAQVYNSFYNDYSILKEKDENTRFFRIGLSQAVGIVIKKGLYLLGINSPERM